jgi:hypothetical protein
VDSISVMEGIRFTHLSRGGIIIGKSATERAKRDRVSLVVIGRERGGCGPVRLDWQLIDEDGKDAYGLGDWSRS